MSCHEKESGLPYNENRGYGAAENVVTAFNHARFPSGNRFCWRMVLRERFREMCFYSGIALDVSGAP